MLSQKHRSKPARLDHALVATNLVSTRNRAQSLIMAGRVLVNGEVIYKAGYRVATGAEISLRAPDSDFVSRGGVKLAGALDEFGWEPLGLVVLDVGASTGGFTDCVLQRGARAVIALDVGYGQLAWSLRQDPRVHVLERTNIRYTSFEQLPEIPDAAVVDVSFISLRLVLPNLLLLLPAGATVIAMIKPQFEAGRQQVGKGGVVRDATVRQKAIDSVLNLCAQLGCEIVGTVTSQLPGPKGNVEEFLWLKTPDHDR